MGSLWTHNMQWRATEEIHLHMGRWEHALHSTVVQPRPICLWGHCEHIYIFVSLKLLLGQLLFYFYFWESFTSLFYTPPHSRPRSRVNLKTNRSGSREYATHRFSEGVSVYHVSGSTVLWRILPTQLITGWTSLFFMWPRPCMQSNVKISKSVLTARTIRGHVNDTSMICPRTFRPCRYNPFWYIPTSLRPRLFHPGSAGVCLVSENTHCHVCLLCPWILLIAKHFWSLFFPGIN